MEMRAFDCIAIKRAAQEKIRAAVSGMNRRQEIEFFRAGADEFERRIQVARESFTQRSTTEENQQV